MSQIHIPRKGSRFIMHDTEYEIQYVNGDEIRYSTINGGKTFHLPITQYNSLLTIESLSVTHDAKLIVHEDNVAELARKMKYVTAVKAGCGSYLKKTYVICIIAKTAKDIGDGKPPAYDTLRKWVHAYEKHGQDNLVPVRNGNSSARFDGETEMIIAEEIEKGLKKGFVLVAVEIHAAVVSRLLTLPAQQDGTVKIPSLRLIQRKIKALDHYVQLIAKHGKEKANRLIRASGKKIIVPYPMSVVQIDTHYLDVIVVDPDTFEPIGRPYLVLIICINTKRIVGHYISLFPPSATTTMQAVKVMLQNFGCPYLIIPDRGVEFINSALFHLCNHLLIQLELSQVRNPNHKANVESFFKTITLWLIQRLKGTTYSNVLARGDYNSAEDAIFTLDQVQTYVDIWINEVYDNKPHSQTKRAPIAMWEKGIVDAPLLKLGSEEIENIARVPETKTVHRGRVTIHNLTYYSHALSGLDGIKVTVLLDEMDLAAVYVKDPNDAKTLIKADSTEPDYTTGLTLNQHQLVREELKELSEAEMASIGEHKWQLGLTRLMDRIRDDELSNKKKKKATNGASLKDTTMHEKARDSESATVAEPESESNQRAKNRPKVSSTRTRGYVDDSEDTFESGQAVEYEVMEI